MADWNFCKDDYISDLIACDCQCDKACKIGEYFGIRNWECKKYPICKDKILNTAETRSVVNTCINKHIHKKRWLPNWQCFISKCIFVFSNFIFIHYYFRYTKYNLNIKIILMC